MPLDESAYRKVRCTSDTPFVRMSQSQQKTVDLVVRDETGAALDLTTLETPYLSSSSAGVNELEVRLAASTTFSALTPIFAADGEITDATLGEVRFEFTPTMTQYAGIFLASLGVFWNDTLKHQQMVYLEFMPNNFGATTSAGPLTVPEVRMDIADVCPDANYLIDELEFTDAEILHCMRKAVDMFNETPPRVIQYRYDNFPHRAAWLGATGAFLLRMIWHRYARGTLDYSAGGISVRDQRYQADTYIREAKQSLEQFREWSQSVQVAQNIELAYGSVGPSPYRRVYYG